MSKAQDGSPIAQKALAVDWESIDGVRLRYAHGGNGRPLVLLHTLRTQLEYFLPLVQHLDLTQTAVLIPDLPGHGESDAPPVDYTAQLFTDSIERFLEARDVDGAVVAGESIGAVIALSLAARGNARIQVVVALNPYDYGRRGGIRRSSALANVLFSAILVPGLGFIVARSGTRGILRRVMNGGVEDKSALTSSLITSLHRNGNRPGHARAFRSLCVHWRSWVDARRDYASIKVPVVLGYSDHDWSKVEERAANERAIPTAERVSLGPCGHFSCLERPAHIASVIARTLDQDRRGD